ncbi:MAG: EAL domain-containing protein [Acidaminococcaceae bacterium]
MLPKMLQHLAKRISTFTAFLLCLLLIGGSFFSPLVEATDETKPQVVKVGYAYSGDSTTAAELNNYSSYNFEYLRAIAERTNWQYKFVYGSWEECLEWLDQGKVDLLSNANKTAERTERFAYSIHEAGVEYAVLCVDNDQKNVYYEDYAAFNGMQVGLVKGSYQNELFEAYEQKHQLQMSKVYFDSENEQVRALKEGRIQALVTGSLGTIDQVRVVARFSPSPFYFIAAKHNTQLVQQLDSAIEDLLVENPDYQQSLQRKYYGETTAFKAMFTRQEMEFIKEQPELVVAIDPKWQPVEYYDAEEGVAKGITVDLLQEISKISGLKFSFIPLSSYQERLALVQSGKADLIASYNRSLGDSTQYNLALSKAYVKVPISLMLNKGNLPTNDVKIGIAENNLDIYRSTQKEYPFMKIMFYPTTEQAIEALREGYVHYVADNTYMLEKLLQEPGNREMQLLPYSSGEQIYHLGIAEQRAQVLLSIINKSITHISNERRNQILTSNIASAPYHLSLYILAQKYLYQFLSIVAVVVLAFFAVIVYTNRKKKLELTKIAFYDALTGAGNLAKFKLEANKLLPRGDYVVVQLDINRFKAINNGFGSKEGDRLLRTVAQGVAQMLGKDELFARENSDWFILLLHNADNEHIKERLLALEAAVNDLICAGNRSYAIALTFGVYRFAREEVTVEDGMESAVLAHQAAKQQSSERVTFYEAHLREAILRENDIENRMEAALQNGEFVIFLQGKYNSLTETLIGAEALVRWQTPDGNMPPNAFIDTFERNGFILKLDRYVFEQTCQCIQQWQREGLRIVPVSVNISRTHLLDTGFIAEYSAIIEKYQVPPELLELELTENLPLDEISNLLPILDAIKRMGVTLSMDDFGSGYSSLNILRQLPFDILKLDRLFFQDQTNTDKGRNIIASVVLMARKLGLDVIAEGVETREQVDFLKSIGCYSVQGYYYAKPCAEQQFRRLLTPDKEKY